MSAPFCRRVFGFVIAVVLTGASVASAQPPATITGVVSDPTGAPVAAARVELAGGASPARSAMSDAAGRYRFDSVAPGE